MEDLLFFSQITNNLHFFTSLWRVSLISSYGWKTVHFGHFFHVSPMHPSPSTMWQNTHYLRLVVPLVEGGSVSKKLCMSTRYIQGAVYLEIPGPESSVAELHVYLPRISREEATTGLSGLSSPTLFFFFFLLINHPVQKWVLSFSFFCIIATAFFKYNLSLHQISCHYSRWYSV